ncbi:Hypothetical predicted protein, partial [Olea europaea subsp. europaea]
HDYQLHIIHLGDNLELHIHHQILADHLKHLDMVLLDLVVDIVHYYNPQFVPTILIIVTRVGFVLE